MEQYFTMKVTHPLSAHHQTYVGARYLRHGGAIWDLPTARYVTGMLNVHGMQNAKHVVTLAVNRNDDGDESEEASAEEHRSLRRIVGKSQFLAPRRPDIAFATNRLARSLAGSRTASAEQSVLNSDSVHRQRLGWRSTHAQVRVFVGNHAGLILAQCRCNRHVKLSTSRPPQPRVKRSTARLCSWLVDNT